MKKHLLKVIPILILFISLTGFTNNIHKKKPKAQTIKVALLLDTSNSMDGLIKQAKAQLWEIVNELSYARYGIQKPNLEIALYEYGNDNLNAEEGFIRQVLEFSTDLDVISEKLFGLTTKGGQEYCGHVINSSIDQLKWGKNKEDLRLIFIAGNEPFTQGKFSYQEAISNAKKKDIIINTIYCGSYNQGINGKWQDGAKLGGGEYMTINQNKNIVHIVTPYDDQIIILNKRLNKTYIYYGKSGYRRYVTQSEQDSNARKLSAPTSVKRAITKSKRFYKNSQWDLVDASEKENYDFSKLDKKYLPKELQNKSVEEIKSYVEVKRKERIKIKKKIAELEIKRNKFVAQKQKEDMKKGELESVMLKAIKKQAAARNYKW